MAGLRGFAMSAVFWRLAALVFNEWFLPGRGFAGSAICYYITCIV